jgi:peptidyl-prolyl isomerase D
MTSGALYDAAQATALAEADQRRLKALADNAELPLVWLDVAVKGQVWGR